MTEIRKEASSSTPVPLTAAKLQDLDNWLRSKTVAARMTMLTEGLELSLGSEERTSHHKMSIDVTDGRLVLEAAQKDLERLLMIVGNELAHEHGVELQNAELKLKGLRPRQVDWLLNAKAKRGFFSAAVEVKGRLSITDQFEAQLTGLDIRGNGILGTMVAAWVRPRLQEVEGDKIAIASLIPGNVQLQDVRFEIDERVRLIAHVDQSSLLLPKLPLAGDKAPAKPTAATQNNKKADIYILDTGWNTKAKALLDGHLVLFHSYLADQNVYILSATQAKEILTRHPTLVGADPILMVVDSDRRTQRPSKNYGLRFCLGQMANDAERAETLQRMLRIVAKGPRNDGRPIVPPINSEMQREHMGDAIQTIMDVVEAAATR